MLLGSFSRISYIRPRPPPLNEILSGVCCTSQWRFRSHSFTQVDLFLRFRFKITAIIKDAAANLCHSPLLN